MGVEALGDLIVNISVDTSGLAQGLDSAAAQVKQGASNMASELDGLDGSLGKLGDSATKAWTELGDGKAKFDELAESLKSAGAEMVSAGEALTVGITVPLAALGTAALAAATDFNNALEQMSRATGDMGEKVAGLDAVFKDVFANLPVSAKDAATAIDALSQRLGLAGPELEAIATQMLNLARITGQQVGPMVNEASRAFQQWGVSTADMSRELDLLYTASTRTGAPVQAILGELVRFGPALREMGMSFDQATGLLAKLDQEGLNSAKVLQGLNLAIRNMSKAGIDNPAEGLPVLIQMIKDAGSAGEANAIGLKAFGRSSIDITDAIRSGKLDVADFVKQLQDSTVSINDLASHTLTLGERFTQLKNEMETALAPLGDSLLRILEGVLTGMKPVIEMVGEMAKAFAGLDPTTQAVIIGFGAILAAIGPLIAGVGLLSNGLAALVSFAGTVTSALGGLSGVLTTIATVAGVAAAAFAGWKLGEWLKNNLGDVQDLSYGMGVQLANAVHTATTSSVDFKKAMGDATAAAKGFGADGKAAAQSADQIKAALDRLVTGAEKAATAVKAIPFKDIASPEVLAAIKAVTDEHNKAFAAIVKADEQLLEERAALGEVAKGWTDVQVVAASTQQAFDAVTQSMHAQLDTLSQSTNMWKDLQATLLVITPQVYTLTDAFKDMGVTSTADLVTNLDKAEDALSHMQQLFDQGLASETEMNLAIKSQLEAQIALNDRQDAGAANLSKELDDVNAKLGIHATRTRGAKTAWDELASGANKAIGDLSKGLANVIVAGGSFSKVVIQIGKDFATTFLDIGIKAVLKFVKEALVDGLGTALDNLKTAINSVGSAFSKVFGSAPSAGGGGAGGADSAGGAAGSAAGGVMGAVTMVSGIVSAISGIIGNFQMAHMNKLLGEIEVSTRGALNQLISLQNTFNTYLPKLSDILTWVGKSYGEIFNIHTDTMAIQKAITAPAAHGTSVNGTYYIAITDVDMKTLLDQLVAMLQLRGLKV